MTSASTLYDDSASNPNHHRVYRLIHYRSHSARKVGSLVFGILARKAEIYDDDGTNTTTTTGPLGGRAIARLLSLPLHTTSSSSPSPSLSDYKNKYIYLPRSPSPKTACWPLSSVLPAQKRLIGPSRMSPSINSSRTGRAGQVRQGVSEGAWSVSSTGAHVQTGPWRSIAWPGCRE